MITNYILFISLQFVCSLLIFLRFHLTCEYFVFCKIIFEPLFNQIDGLKIYYKTIDVINTKKG